MIAATTLTLLLASPTSALPSVLQGVREDGEWITIDGVAAVVNDEIITEVELARESKTLLARNRISITTQEELEEFESQVRSAVVLRRLQSQAGRELGIAEEEVNRVVDNHLGNLRQRLGLVTYIDDLESRGLAASDAQSETRRQYYRATWEGSVVGDEVGGQRPHRDRFVRPGEMKFYYGEFKHLFSPPAEVRLTQFAVLQEAAQTAEQLVEMCMPYLERARAGDSLESLRDELGLERCGIRNYQVSADELDAGLREFAVRAAPGEISEIGVAQAERLVASFFVLDGRREGGPPEPFLSGRVQAELTRRALSQRDQWYLLRGQQDLLDTAYIVPALAPETQGPPVPGPQR